jgi:acyl dehydratase
MTSAGTGGLVTDLTALRESAGTHLGYTDWEEMTQERVNQFAAATGDYQFIHIDVERARQTPFGGTIAHGYLTLSLMAPVMQRLLNITDAAMGLNYGLDRVRFPAPLPVGAQWRGCAEIADVKDIPGGLQVKVRGTSRSRASRSRPAWPSAWSASTGERRPAQTVELNWPEPGQVVAVDVRRAEEERGFGYF